MCLFFFSVTQCAPNIHKQTISNLTTKHTECLHMSNDYLSKWRNSIWKCGLARQPICFKHDSYMMNSLHWRMFKIRWPRLLLNGWNVKLPKSVTGSILNYKTNKTTTRFQNKIIINFLNAYLRSVNESTWNRMFRTKKDLSFLYGFVSSLKCCSVSCARR